MNLNTDEFASRLVQDYLKGIIQPKSELWNRCHQNPRLYGVVMEKLKAQSSDEASRHVSSESDASTESASGQTDSKEPERVQGVRTRSRATKSIEQAKCEVKPRAKVSKKVRFPDHRPQESQSLVCGYRRGWYTEQGIRCLCFLWEQTQRFATSVGLCAIRVGADWWKRLQG